MNAAIRQVIDELLIALQQDVSEVPETGPFPERRRAGALPPPYGPARRLVLTLTAADGYEMLRHIEARVEDEHGYQSQAQFVGTSAEARQLIDSGEALAKVSSFLEPVLERVDQLIEAVQPLDVPLVAIHRGNALYAALDPRRAEFERWGPGDLHISKWHLLLRAGDAWRDAGVAQEQAEAERFYLRSRVLKTIGSFHGQTVDEFSFHVWEGTGPPVPLKGAAEETRIDQQDDVIARLRVICRDIINRSTNYEQALIEEIKAGRPDAQRAGSETPALRLHSVSMAGGRIGMVLLGALFGLLLLYVALDPILEALRGNPDFASLLIFGAAGLFFLGGSLMFLPGTVLWVDVGATIKIRKPFRAHVYTLDEVAHAHANPLGYRHFLVELGMRDGTSYQVSVNAETINALQTKFRELGRPTLANALAS